MPARFSVWVTGASGMLGRVLARRLSRSYEVIGIARSGNFGTKRCDLSNRTEVQALFEGARPDALIHTAAYSDVDGCERDAERAYQSNALAVKHLAEFCGRDRTPLVHVSTDYVFNGSHTGYYKEEDRTCPVNIYGLTKLAGEYHALTAAGPTAVLRTSWLFGPDNAQNFVNALLARLRKEKLIRVLDDQVDSPTSVEDLSEALEKITERFLRSDKAAASHEVYHFCNTGKATRLEMAVQLRDWMKLKDVRVERADRAGIANRLAPRPAHCVMSVQKYEKAFQVKIRSWQESLKEYVCGF